MAQLNRQELKDQAETTRNTNGIQSLTGATENAMWQNTFDSAVLRTEAEEYQWFNDTDPEAIGTPPASNYYQGVFNGKRWTKDSAGLIVYSASGLWTITDTAATDIPLVEDNLGNLIRWNGTANGTLRLDNSVFGFDEGWHSAIYNNTPNLSITVEAGGTDIIRSHNNIFQVPAYSYVEFGIIYVNGAVEWAVAIEQTRFPGIGQIAKGQIGLNVPVTADVWELVPYATYDTGQLVNVTPTANGGLQITYPNNGNNGVYVDVDIMASISIPNATQVVDLAFGVDGTVSTSAEIVHQRAQAGASQTADMFWPYYFHFSGVLPNGSTINPFIRSSQTDTIPIISLTLTVRVQSYTGVDIG